MKKIVVIATIALMLSGCAYSRIMTSIGSNIGSSYSEAAEKGAISADQSIQAWPYIAGLIKGVYADNYAKEAPLLAQYIIAKLDDLAAKETLSTEEKGLVIGYYVRLEAIAAESAWESRYGISIYRMVMRMIEN